MHIYYLYDESRILKITGSVFQFRLLYEIMKAKRSMASPPIQTQARFKHAQNKSDQMLLILLLAPRAEAV